MRVSVPRVLVALGVASVLVFVFLVGVVVGEFWMSRDVVALNETTDGTITSHYSVGYYIAPWTVVLIAALGLVGVGLVIAGLRSQRRRSPARKTASPTAPAE